MAVSLKDLEAALIAADKAGNVEDATRLASALVTMRNSQSPTVDPTAEMSGPQKFLAGTGKGMVDVGRGLRQLFPGGPSREEIDVIKQQDAPLMNTGAGLTGGIVGNVAAMAPALAIPGAGTVAGAAAVGAGSGALQPVGTEDSRLKNMAIGGALGGAAQAGIGKAAQLVGKRLAEAEARAAAQAAQNAVRDETLRASQQAGYVIPPSQAGGGLGSRILEGISGKAKTNQAAAIKNQNVTNRLARQALGLSDDAPLTAEMMQEVRNRAYQQGYEPLANAGAIETDAIFKKTLDSITENYRGASRSFQDAVPPEVVKRIDSLRTGAMDIGDGLKMTQILRDEAGRAYAAGDKGLGKATKQAANAIEDQIERALQSAGKDGAELLKNFRQSRELMAKAHNVEKAIVEGSGQVNAKVLGAALQRQKPLSGDLKTIGAFANTFRDVAGIPQSGWANPLTVLDAFGAAAGAGMGAGPLAAALPGARIGARSLVLNPAFQKAFANPNYAPGSLKSLPPKVLKELERLGVGGLFGPSVYSEQE